MFAIVEDEEEFFFAEVVEKLGWERAVASGGEVGGFEQGGGEVGGVGEGGEGDEEDAVQEGGGQLCGGGEGEAGFADAAGAGEGEQAGTGGVKAGVNGGEFGFAAKEGAGGGGEGVEGTGVPDAGVQVEGVGGGFEAEFAGEGGAEGFVLGKGGGALAGVGEGKHHGLMGIFVPGFEVELAAGVVQSLGVFAPVGVVGAQVVKRIKGEEAEVFALEGAPFVEEDAVGEVEPGEEVTCVEGEGGCEGGGTGRTEFGQAVGVSLPGLKGAAEGGDINVKGQGGVELDALVVGEEVFGVARWGGDDFAEVGEGLAQAVEGFFFGLVGPEQARKGLAQVGAGFEDEINQQGAGFVGNEACDGFPVACGLEGFEEGEGEHGRVIINRGGMPHWTRT